MAKLFLTLFLVSALFISTILSLEADENELANAVESESVNPEASLDKKEAEELPGNKFMNFRRSSNKYANFRRGGNKLMNFRRNVNKYANFRRDAD